MVRGRLSGDAGGGILPGGLFGGGMGESSTAGTVCSTIGRVVIIPEGRVTTRVVLSVDVVGGKGEVLTRSNASEEAEVDG